MLGGFEILGDLVFLKYDDGDQVMVSKADFDRAFACMVSCPKNEISRDFGIR